MRFVLALAFVLALMGLAAQLIKRMGWGKIGPLGGTGKRLSVIEVRQIDGRHKLALIKCDDREHLLVLGPEGQTTVDLNIKKKAAE